MTIARVYGNASMPQNAVDEARRHYERAIAAQDAMAEAYHECRRLLQLARTNGAEVIDERLRQSWVDDAEVALVGFDEWEAAVAEATGRAA